MYLVVAAIVGFVIFGFGLAGGLENFFVVRRPTLLYMPWTLVTWPFIPTSAFGTIFSTLALWWCGGSLERSWGTRTYTAFFFACAAVTGFTYWIGQMLLGQSVGLAGMSAAVVPCIVAWCALSRRESVLLFFIPVPALLFAVLSVVFLWISLGAPFLGLFGLSGAALGYWYAMYGRRGSGIGGTNFGFSRASSSRPSAPRTRNVTEQGRIPQIWTNPMAWWRDRQERRRLERIFRNSGYSDPDR